MFVLSVYQLTRQPFCRVSKFFQSASLFEASQTTFGWIKRRNSSTEWISLASFTSGIFVPALFEIFILAVVLFRGKQDSFLVTSRKSKLDEDRVHHFQILTIQIHSDS